MTGLLEFREKIKQLYIKTEFLLVPFLKFLLALVALITLNGQLGYMTKLDNIAIVLIVALMCSFLPNGFIILFAALFSLLHIYALSMEAAAVSLCMYLVMFLLFLCDEDTICGSAGSRAALWTCFHCIDWLRRFCILPV